MEGIDAYEPFYHPERHIVLEAKSILVACAQLYLAEQLDLQPADLVYVGVQPVIKGILLMFNVEKGGHKLNGSTKSVAFSDAWEPH